MESLISIIVPAYNAEKTIKRCIVSVLEQSYPFFELIIINDGSTDSTKAICESFLHDSRVRVINKKNAGVSTARNTGLHCCNGEYVVFVDADDTIPNHTCEQYACAMKSGVDLCLADVWRIKHGQTLESSPISSILSSGIYVQRDILKAFGALYSGAYTNSPWGKCYRRDKIIANFAERISIGEDLLFNLSFLKNCARIMILEDKLYNYYIQEGNTLSSSFKMESFEMLRCVYNETIAFCEKMEISEAICAVDQKYVSDMTVMFERMARSQHMKEAAQKMGQIYQIYELAVPFEKTTISAGIKYSIEKRLIQKQMFGLFCVFSRITLLAKSLLGMWKQNG